MGALAAAKAKEFPDYAKFHSLLSAVASAPLRQCRNCFNVIIVCHSIHQFYFPSGIFTLCMDGISDIIATPLEVFHSPLDALSRAVSNLILIFSFLFYAWNYYLLLIEAFRFYCYSLTTKWSILHGGLTSR